jgi:hypothetical protein
MLVVLVVLMIVPVLMIVIMVGPAVWFCVVTALPPGVVVSHNKVSYLATSGLRPGRFRTVIEVLRYVKDISLTFFWQPPAWSAVVTAGPRRHRSRADTRPKQLWANLRFGPYLADWVSAVCQDA